MYKTSAEYFREHRPSITIYSQYKRPSKNTITQIKEHYYHPQHTQHTQHPQHTQHTQHPQTKEDYYPQHTKTPQMTWKNSKYSNMVDPKVWGPSFWFTLHSGAATYPIKANKIYRERMKGFIKGIPVMLPCVKCSGHAFEYIGQYEDKLDHIVSGRGPLFEFFWNFHNVVNKRHGKKEMSLKDASNIYYNGVDINILSYE